MAQATQPLLYVCRHCRRSLRSAAQVARPFSSTAVRPKVIPSFTPTGNSELDQVFSSWRQKVFVPAALQDHHRALVYKKSRHQTLLNDPGVTVTMSDDEEIKLEPMNFYDKPNKGKSVKMLLGSFSNSNEDAVWNNLPVFLTGMTMSKEPLPEFFFEKMTRKACEIGKERIILYCVERSEETGFRLSRPGVTRELMLGFHRRAALHDFTGPELETAARRAEKVARQLEDELHGETRLKDNEVDPRSDPLVTSVLTELAAARAAAADSADRQADEEKVANYATKMLHLSGTEHNTASGDTSSKMALANKHALNHELEQLLPQQNAIMLSLKIDSIKNSPLGKDLEAHLEELKQRVENIVEKVRANAGGKPRRGLLMYDQVNGK